VRPVVYLLSGLTGSGKTTFAKRLEAEGVMRLSVDEEVHARHGRYGIDYPEHEYFQRERPVVEEVQRRLAELVQAGQDMVLDYGLWRRVDATPISGWWRPTAASGGCSIFVPTGRCCCAGCGPATPARAGVRERAAAGWPPWPGHRRRSPSSQGDVLVGGGVPLSANWRSCSAVSRCEPNGAAWR
jgi:hypothetical protein